mmetsp:Transcript_7841/g.13164  ORF Transcript_7841/g.13164 Transcript_7841/m.13164 type:complete len:115 (-) Transcript_7841:196-540(-)
MSPSNQCLVADKICSAPGLSKHMVVIRQWTCRDDHKLHSSKTARQTLVTWAMNNSGGFGCSTNSKDTNSDRLRTILALAQVSNTLSLLAYIQNGSGHAPYNRCRKCQLPNPKEL